MLKKLITSLHLNPQFPKFLKTSLHAFGSQVQIETPHHNYNINFESLKLTNPETVKKIELKVISSLDTSDQIVEWINCLESAWNQKEKGSVAEILSKLKALQNSFTGKHFQLLIAFVETVEFENLKRDFEDNKEEKLKLEKLILENLDKINWKDIDFFEEKRIKNALGIKVEYEHDDKKILNILTFWGDKNKDDLNGKFVKTLAVLEFYFGLESEKQITFQEEIRKIVKTNVNLFSLNRFIKFLTFCDFSNELFDADLNFEIEKRIADALKGDIEITQLLKIVTFLANNNQVFRQKLIFVLNETVLKNIKEFPLKNVVELWYLNCSNEITEKESCKNLPSLQTIDIANVHDSDLILKLKYLQFARFGVSESQSLKINDKFDSLDVEGLRADQLLKIYMFNFHEGKKDKTQLLREQISKANQLEFKSVKDLIIEVSDLWEKGLINESIWKENFEIFFDYFVGEMQRSENMRREEKLFLRDFISQVTDKYDEVLREIN